MMAMGGLYYYGGRGLPRDQERAVRYFRDAADAGAAPGFVCLRGRRSRWLVRCWLVPVRWACVCGFDIVSVRMGMPHSLRQVAMGNICLLYTSDAADE